MDDFEPIQSTPLRRIADNCAEESVRFFRGKAYDSRYCFELFRRALVEKDQQAWGYIYLQYRPLVRAWVERHNAFPALGESATYFVNRAFEKMWSAVTPEKFDRFSDLKGLLRYLQMCVHSVIIDEVRQSERYRYAVNLEDVPSAPSTTVPSVERHVLQEMDRTKIWAQLEERMRSEKERIVLECAFVLDLKPRMIAARYPEVFRSVDEVYRVKQNLLARLRRDDKLRNSLGINA
jgi:RNA polymerase sigma factor (sigma-70 family)